ncbi:hypothetical protein [Novosphingobium sp. Rr 2-17]|uniref:hypothetical protein n=1 Tax=Novosphingobium sp. Rr 2-17 TaxID=555793 RepID=UPI0012F6E8CA|nr:hypothetical protein [Novosphingobium sp. Rr 2-17]
MNAHWFSRLGRHCGAVRIECGVARPVGQGAAIEDFGMIDGDRALAAVLAFAAVRKVRESETGLGLGLGLR